MTLMEILQKCGELAVYEKRKMEAEYNELVVFNKDLSRWERIFGEIFGPPAKPPGREISVEDFKLTKPYGGVQDNQTLFKKETADAVMIAMFWPWQDMVHTTIKIVVIKKP